MWMRYDIVWERNAGQSKYYFELKFIAHLLKIKTMFLSCHITHISIHVQSQLLHYLRWELENIVTFMQQCIVLLEKRNALCYLEYVISPIVSNFMCSCNNYCSPIYWNAYITFSTGHLATRTPLALLRESTRLLFLWKDSLNKAEQNKTSLFEITATHYKCDAKSF